MGLLEHNCIRLRGRILGDVDPLHRAETTHKVDVRDPVHPEEHRIAHHPAVLALCSLLPVEDLHQKLSRHELRDAVDLHDAEKKDV